MTTDDGLMPSSVSTQSERSESNNFQLLQPVVAHGVEILPSVPSLASPSSPPHSIENLPPPVFTLVADEETRDALESPHSPPTEVLPTFQTTTFSVQPFDSPRSQYPSYSLPPLPPGSPPSLKANSSSVVLLETPLSPAPPPPEYSPPPAPPGSASPPQTDTSSIVPSETPLSPLPVSPPRLCPSTPPPPSILLLSESPPWYCPSPDPSIPDELLRIHFPSAPVPKTTQTISKPVDKWAYSSLPTRVLTDNALRIQNHSNQAVFGSVMESLVPSHKYPFKKEISECTCNSCGDLSFIAPPSKTFPATTAILSRCGASTLEYILSKDINESALLVYTDGSCGNAQNQHVVKPIGAAVAYRWATSETAYCDPTHPDWNVIAWRGRGYESNEAEMLAIATACYYIKSLVQSKPNTKLIILTDSETSLKQLVDPVGAKTTKRRAGIAKVVRQLVINLFFRRIDTYCLWIPAHTDEDPTIRNILGNVIVDTAAGEQRRLSAAENPELGTTACLIPKQYDAMTALEIANWRPPTQPQQRSRRQIDYLLLKSPLDEYVSQPQHASSLPKNHVTYDATKTKKRIVDEVILSSESFIFAKKLKPGLRTYILASILAMLKILDYQNY
ncbi:hypothetical protein BT63DRAFT_470144 [Microthyrium microscopicum]|uniref:RNase H type-1 domain-containing protein n=1 Tax=Microthyrium microscopicum TaxID=703497 RepID=A0A6A6UHX4_9PEZI|nr:hypothetical protein BT63DRAFT_470144 [Microthyrium microscopicum]